MSYSLLCSKAINGFLLPTKSNTALLCRSVSFTGRPSAPLLLVLLCTHLPLYFAENVITLTSPCKYLGFWFEDQHVGNISCRIYCDRKKKKSLSFLSSLPCKFISAIFKLLSHFVPCLEHDAFFSWKFMFVPYFPH